MLCMIYVTPVQAAEKTASITSCKIDNSKKKVEVKVKVKKKTSEMGKKLYLIALPTYSQAVATTTTKPLTSVKLKTGTSTIKVKLNAGSSKSVLQSRFVVAYKKSGKYRICSEGRYITNPEKIATYTSSYPKTTSKKGLQVEDTEDALDLDVQHAVLNMTLNSIVQGSGGTSYKYKGKTYHFNENVLAGYDAQIKTYNESGAKVTIILLLSTTNTSNVKNMMFSKYGMAKYTGINMANKKGALQFEAIMSYLADRYAKKEHVVSGWILGNEIDAPSIWNYGGNKSLGTYMDNYVKSYRVCYNAVRSENKNAKVYVSVDNSWNLDVDGSGKRYFTTKGVLDNFNKKVKAQGNVVWSIAFHAYSQGMLDPYFWDDTLATSKTNTKIIDFKNLNVLTNYVKKNYNSKIKIMLSEQSFDVKPHGETGQAAAFAYAYYISESNSMIDYYIYGRHIDNAEEAGYNWGLKDSSGHKRAIWDVFQYIDSKEGFEFTNPLLSSISTISSWNKISGFKKSRFTSMESNKETATISTVTAKAGTDYATVNWARLRNATGYEIFRSTNPTSGFERIKLEDVGTAVSYNDTSVVPGTVYYYKVRMYKAIPTGGAVYGYDSNVVGVTVPAGTTKITGNVVDGTSITINWTKAAGASGYRVYMATEKNGTYTSIKYLQSGDLLSFKKNGLTPGAYYYFKVRAYYRNAAENKNYYGVYSSAVGARAKPAAVKWDNGASACVSGKNILTWNAVANMTGYRIERFTGADLTNPTLDKKLKADDKKYIYTTDKFQYIDEDVQTGVTYTYRIRAYIKVGDANYYSTSYSEDKVIVTTPQSAAAPASIDAAGIMQNEMTLTDGKNKK